MSSIVFVDHNGNEHELPKMTIAIAEKFAAVTDAETQRKKWAAEFEALKVVLGKQATTELLDGSTLDKIDLITLDVNYALVKDAYAQPGRDAQMAQVDNLDIDKLIQLSEVLEKIERSVNRQAFRSVR